MAGTSLLSLLDDIATVLDDVSVLTKVAAKKTAGVLGDDLALNAEQVAGVSADRELPVVWAVAKGSCVNKVILVPSALAISALLPAAITPLLMLGGAFLCFEGAEKLHHALFHGKTETDADTQLHRQALVDPSIDLVAYEKDKIRGAIRTDFVLSAEIIVITLGSVAGEPLGMQIATLVAIAVLMTVGVYGFVAGIVKLDDGGIALSRSNSGPARALGKAILLGAPWLMKFLSVAGTAAMFLVGGSILGHGLPWLHGFTSSWEAKPGGFLMLIGIEALIGLAAGALLVLAAAAIKRLLPSKKIAH